MAAARTRARADDTKPKPRSDAYVGLLGLSLLTLSAAMLFAFLNWNLISATPKPVQAAPKGGGAVMPGPGGPVNPPAAPGVNPPGAPVVPPGGAPVVPPGQPPPQKK